MSTARLEQILTQAWQRRGLLAWLLSPLAMLMWLVVRARHLAYALGWLKPARLPVPVVVVGNRIAGGAGKTPTTLALLQHLRDSGWHPGVLSRGYRAQPSKPEPLLLDAQQAPLLSTQQTGDEPTLIWLRSGAPVMVHRDRAMAGRALLAAHPEVNILVCDDGLQHLQLARDVEIVVFDERGQGNGWLLPAGPLREPITTRSASLDGLPPLLLYNAQQASTQLAGHLAQRGLARLQTLQAWRAASGGMSPDAMRQPQPPRHHVLTAVAGIAQPERFFQALRQQGWQVQGIPLPDHASWATLPWPEDAAHVVVTEKDAVKLDLSLLQRQRPATTVWVAALHFQPEPDFWKALDARLPAPPCSPTAPSPQP